MAQSFPESELYTVHKNSRRMFSIILFTTVEILYKFGGLIPECTQNTTAVAFPV